MKAFAAAVLALALLPATALADPCQADLKAVDKAIESGDVPAEERGQVKDMRNQAADLCQAGNEQEGLDVLAEAKAMLNLE
ncbi:MAG TPA: hypothetical protein P5337_06725 [Aestuariivirga sp.]|nr:hypothetical protein [Alphaproteobacteria bacterium]HRX36075.1 hypothetical protein [Aestuariivirga sp.]